MMSTSYRHLTINEREKIMILLAQGKKQAEIAKALGRSSSTISRELKRHALESYSATNAQNSYLKHRQNSKAQRKLEQPEYFNLVQE
ncbi:helix-turn-helix domain-containing protein, partial [Escherichia coli]